MGDIGADLAQRAWGDVCIHNIRGATEAVATFTRAGSGMVVSIGRFETTISSSSGVSWAR
jgi:hypothetical protein